MLIGLMMLGLAMVLLTGCVSKSEYEALQAEYAALREEIESLKTDYDELNANCAAVEMELAEIKKVYPPRYFSSVMGLQDWLAEDDISERHSADMVVWYANARELQKRALEDGYIIYVNYDYEEGAPTIAFVFCGTMINGDFWYWDPETDEPIQYYGLAK